MKAVVFDFDGVILDTENARYQAWQMIYSSFGKSLPVDVWIQSIGRAEYAVDPYDYLQMQAMEIPDREKIREMHKKFEMEKVNELELLPGVKERILEAKLLGMKLAVASSSSRNWVGTHLKRRGLYDNFDVLICREDTTAHKPSPEPYIAALNRLGCDAGDAFAVEDSPIGIQAAVDAGLFCIAVGCSMTRHLDLSKAGIIAGSLEEITFAELQKSK